MRKPAKLIAIYLIASHAGISPATTCYDDKNLQAAQSAAQPTLLYVWSPRMPLSALHAAAARAQAHALGLAWQPVADHRVPAHERDQALLRLRATQPAAASALQRSRALCSTELEQRDAYRHFPSAFVLGQRVDARPIVGAMPSAFWRQSIAQRLTPQVLP